MNLLTRLYKAEEIMVQVQDDDRNIICLKKISKHEAFAILAMEPDEPVHMHDDNKKYVKIYITK